MQDFDYYLEDVKAEQGKLFELISTQKISLDSFIKLYFENSIHKGIDENNPRFVTMSAEDIYDKVYSLTTDYAACDPYAMWYGHFYATLHSLTQVPSLTLYKTLPVEKAKEYFDPDVDEAVNRTLLDSIFFGETDKYLSPYVTGNFKVNGSLYASVYQYVLHRKAKWSKNFELANKILETSQAHRLMELSKSIKNIDPRKWAEIRYNILFTGTYNFYTQNKSILEEVKKNKGKLLFYASTKDNYLSIGLPMSATTLKDSNHWKGNNTWGTALMDMLYLV